MPAQPTLDPQEAVVCTMVLVAAADGGVTDREIGTMTMLVQTLPVFRDFSVERLEVATDAAVRLLDEADGLNHAASLIRAALPQRLRETAYALACEVVASDREVGQELAPDAPIPGQRTRSRPAGRRGDRARRARAPARRLTAGMARPRRRDADAPSLHAAAPANRRRPRMVPRGRSETLQRIGLKNVWWHDLYHEMNTISWGRFLLIAVAIYLGANLVFACLYLLQPHSIGSAKEGDFGDAFFFSVQTMATIGYGKLTPDTVYANILVTVQTVFAMLLLALTTGMMFARFSRPTARVQFSRNAVIGRHNGAPVLTFRMANERTNQILQAEVSLSLLRTERVLEGGTMRRFYEMRLLRSRSPIFGLTFLVIHPIDEESPLFGVTPQIMAQEEMEFVVIVTGIDATVSQPIHARYSYSYEDVLWNHRFVDIFGYTDDGEAAIDMRKFNQAVPLGQARAPAAADAETDSA